MPVKGVGEHRQANVARRSPSSTARGHRPARARTRPRRLHARWRAGRKRAPSALQTFQRHEDVARLRTRRESYAIPVTRCPAGAGRSSGDQAAFPKHAGELRPCHGRAAIVEGLAGATRARVRRVSVPDARTAPGAASARRRRHRQTSRSLHPESHENLRRVAQAQATQVGNGSGGTLATKLTAGVSSAPATVRALRPAAATSSGGSR